MRKREGFGSTKDHTFDKPGKEANVGGEGDSHNNSARRLTNASASVCE
jgi:hypothetical protein